MQRVCVFCGSSTGGRPAYADAARALGAALARRGIGLVYGGGSIGLMGVLADAVLAGRRRGDRRHPARALLGRDRARRAHRAARRLEHARAQGRHGGAGGRLRRAARRPRHVRGAARDAHLAPARHPPQAGRAARRRRLLARAPHAARRRRRRRASSSRRARRCCWSSATSTRCSTACSRGSRPPCRASGSRPPRRERQRSDTGLLSIAPACARRAARRW